LGGGGGGGGVGLPIGGREDAKGDGNSGFKIQGDDFLGERLLLNLPNLERQTRRFLWLLFLHYCPSKIY